MKGGFFELRERGVAGHPESQTSGGAQSSVELFLLGGGKSYVRQGIHDSGVEEGLCDAAYFVLLEALTSTRHAPDYVSKLSELTLACLKPFGSFAVLREVKAENSDASLAGKGRVAYGEMDKVAVGLSAGSMGMVSHNDIFGFSGGKG